MAFVPSLAIEPKVAVGQPLLGILSRPTKFADSCTTQRSLVWLATLRAPASTQVLATISIRNNDAHRSFFCRTGRQRLLVTDTHSPKLHCEAVEATGPKKFSMPPLTSCSPHTFSAVSLALQPILLQAKQSLKANDL